MGQHDRSYRSLFSFPRMVEDLIRQFVPEAWVDRLDFSTLQRVTPAFISSELEDQPEELWEICRQDGSSVYVYLFIEHRPEVDRYLAIHLMARIGLLYQTLIEKEKLTSDGRLPLIIPVVLHHGETERKDLLDLIASIDATTEDYIPRLRYRVINEGRIPLEDLESRRSAIAQIFLMEQARDWEALRQSAQRLGALMMNPEDGFLRKALLEWLDEMMIARWQEQREKERHEGQEKLMLRQLEHKFGRLDLQTCQRVQSADSEQLLDWATRILTAERLEEVFN